MIRNAPVLTVDVPKLIASVKATREGVKATGRQLLDGMTEAFKAFAADTLRKAVNKAPWKEGNLRGSQSINHEVDDAGLMVTSTIGFNIKYAHIQDAGGTIRPVRAKALFIPLRPGVRPIKGKAAQKASGYVKGVDFTLKQSVTLKGTHYFTSTVDQAVKDAIPALTLGTQNVLRKMGVKG